MKATGIVRRVDDLGRIGEGDPLQTTLTPIDRFMYGTTKLVERLNIK